MNTKQIKLHITTARSTTTQNISRKRKRHKVNKIVTKKKVKS